MANFAVAFNWLMDNEDAPRRFNVTTDNNGGGVVGGINAKSFPEDFARIAALPQAQRGLAIAAFYHKNFWGPGYDALSSDEVAKRVLDMAVNGGAVTAVRLLQGAIPEAGGPAVAIDGELGPNTAHAANACNESQLVLAFKAARVQHYRDIAENNPADAPDLPIWLARAEK